MMDAISVTDRARLQQNLADAGCGKKTIQESLQLQEERKTSELMAILSRRRKRLLQVVRQNQKRLDCLDYLIYSIKTNETGLKKKEKKG